MELTQDDVVRILKLIEESPMGRVTLQVGDFRLEVVKGGPAGGIGPSLETPARSAPPDRSVEAVKTAPAVQKEPEAKPPAAVDSGLLSIKAPILGIFYRRPQPGQPPYVEEGSLVDEDTTVALIEVMKLFNPVKAGVKGRIRSICVKDNELVQYDQVLYLVKPE